MTPATSTPASRESRLLQVLGSIDDGAGTLADAFREYGYSPTLVRRHRGFHPDDVMLYQRARVKVGKRAQRSSADVRGKVAMVRRMLRKLGEDVAQADVEELAELGQLREELDAAMDKAVLGLRSRFDTPWEAIAEATGYKGRQGAHRRFGSLEAPAS